MQIRTVAGLVSILMGMSVATAQAQFGSNETALLGGLVSATVAGADVENVSRHTGLMGAVQLVHPFTRQIGLQTELGVIQKGASLSLGAGNGTSTLKLQYFEVPAMLRISFASKYSEVRPAIFFGPAVALNVGCKYKVPTGTTGGTFESDCDPDGPDISAIDYSVVAGGSIEFGSFGAFARYDHGLRTIDSSSPPDDVKNRAIIIGVIWNTSNR
jgi:hypothetical protein